MDTRYQMREGPEEGRPPPPHGGVGTTVLGRVGLTVLEEGGKGSSVPWRGGTGPRGG